MSSSRHEQAIDKTRAKNGGRDLVSVASPLTTSLGQSEPLTALMPALRRYFAKRAAAADIDDLVQEVFVRMHGSHASAPIDHLDRYVFTVAASVLTDLNRRRNVRHVSEHQSLEEKHYPIEERTPERVLLDREALDVVVRAISELPARTRDVFVLHRFEEMSGQSIAATLGLSVSTVEKNIMRALKHLQGRCTLK